ncbi:MAG: hypothetical protein U1E15_04330 [Hyphomicrobiales bacterium]
MASSRSSSQSSRNSGGSHMIDEVVSLAKLFTLRRKAFSSREFQAIGAAVSDFAASMAEYPWVKSQVDMISDSMEALTDYAENADIETVLHDAEVFARRHPVALFTGALAGGMVAGRILWPEHESPRAGGRNGKSGKRSGGRKSVKRGTAAPEARGHA